MSKGKINSEREQLPAVSADISWGRMLAMDAKGLVAGGKVKGALCAAEPGNSLQRDRGRSTGLGASILTFLYWFGGV